MEKIFIPKCRERPVTRHRRFKRCFYPCDMRFAQSLFGVWWDRESVQNICPPFLYLILVAGVLLPKVFDSGAPLLCSLNSAFFLEFCCEEFQSLLIARECPCPPIAKTGQVHSEVDRCSAFTIRIENASNRFGFVHEFTGSLASRGTTPARFPEFSFQQFCHTHTRVI